METLPDFLKKKLQEFDDRHSRDFGTDAEYSDKEMVSILSNVIKQNYEEDRAWFINLFGINEHPESSDNEL